MKNISRRVFIKGLAVAGVAAAASTVLAGCNTNMIPGVDDGTEDEGTETPTNQKITLTDASDDKSMTIEATGFQYISETKMAILSLHVDNRLNAKVTFNNSPSATGSKNYFVVPSFKTTDKDNNVATGTLDTETNKTSDNALGTTKFALNSNEGKDTKIYLTMPEKKNWEKIEITFTLQGDYPGTGGSGHQLGEVAHGSFTYNK